MIFGHSDLSDGALAIENQWQMIRLRDPKGENSAKRSHPRVYFSRQGNAPPPPLKDRPRQGGTLLKFTQKDFLLFFM